MTTRRTEEMTEHLRSAADQARAKAGEAYAAARDKAASAYDTARERTRAAGHQAATSVEEHPFAAVMSAAAVGLLAGALLPTTRTEAKAFNPIGDKISDAARSALSAARGAGRDTLDSLGFNEAAARDQIGKLLDGVVKALLAAPSAAASTEDPH